MRSNLGPEDNTDGQRDHMMDTVLKGTGHYVDQGTGQCHDGQNQMILHNCMKPNLQKLLYLPSVSVHFQGPDWLPLC